MDFRISTLPTVLGEKIVMRILDKENLTFSLDLLGFPPDMLKQLKLLLAKPYGLLLVTGPTGSGKTTTLYSALELIKILGLNSRQSIQFRALWIGLVSLASQHDQELYRRLMGYPDDLPDLRRLQPPGQDLEQRRLPRAVRPDEAGPVPLEDAEREVLE